uniref:Cytochrome c oxidase subunit 6B2 n=1 Tax=Equus caballus TaxID=9796 RepID=A0A3Q2IBE6_HORSE
TCVHRTPRRGVEQEGEGRRVGVVHTDPAPRPRACPAAPRSHWLGFRRPQPIRTGVAIFVSCDPPDPEARGEAPPLPTRCRADASLELPLPWMWDIDSQKPPKGRWSTPPFDPRFPNQNQTRNCYQNFLDYHRCVKNMNRRGKSTQPCEYYFRVFHSLCPMSWVQRWTEQIKAGTFAGKI